MADGSLVICGRCGFGNVPGDQFCGSCGAFLEWEGERTAAAGPATPAPAPPDSAWPPVPADAAARPPGPGAPAASAPTVLAGAGATAATGGTASGAPEDDGLVRCPACGTANPATRTFCQSCGTTLSAASRVAELSPEAIAAAVAAVPGAAPTASVPAASPGVVTPRAAAPRSGGIGRWLVVMAVLGVVVGVALVVGGTVLRSPGPASGASEAPGAGGVASSPGVSGGGGSTASPAAGASGVPPEAGPLVLTGATASSVVGDRAKFQAGKAIDGDLKTSWQEGSKNEKGQWIEVSFAPSRADAVVIRNGYQASDALYRGNLRLKDVLIAVNGGEPLATRLRDTKKAQTIDLGGVAGATTVRITIVSTYPSAKTSVAGTPFDDAALSEIGVIGVPGG